MRTEQLSATSLQLWGQTEARSGGGENGKTRKRENERETGLCHLRRCRASVPSDTELSLCGKRSTVSVAFSRLHVFTFSFLSGWRLAAIIGLLMMLGSVNADTTQADGGFSDAKPTAATPPTGSAPENILTRLVKLFSGKEEADKKQTTDPESRKRDTTRFRNSEFGIRNKMNPQSEIRSPKSGEQRVTIRAENESLRKLLITLFRQYGANFIADGDVRLDEPVTFHLENVPLKLALDEILASRGYGYIEIENGILRIMTLEKIAELRAQTAQLEATARASNVMLETTETGSAVKVFHLQYTPVATAKEALKDLMSPEGKIVEDTRSHSIILIDSAAHLTGVEPLMEQVIEALDQEVIGFAPAGEPQIALTAQLARKVIRLNYADPTQVKETLTLYLTPRGTIEAFIPGESGGGAGASGGGSSLGSELGQVVGQGGYIVVVDAPDAVAAIEEAVAALDVPIPQVEIQVHIIETIRTEGSETGVEWNAVDKDSEASLGVSASGGQLRFGTLSSAEFAAILHALETKANTRLLASPHITVVENQTAQFHSGEEVPFRRSIIQQGIQEVEVFFKSVGIVLTVMAQVKADDRISLLLSAQVSSLGERPPEGEPSINTRKATTQMLIPDGDTVTIGGLTNERMLETISKVPVLGSVPLLGGLFRSRDYTKSLNEITIYLTPNIIQP